MRVKLFASQMPRLGEPWITKEFYEITKMKKLIPVVMGFYTIDWTADHPLRLEVDEEQFRKLALLCEKSWLENRD